MMRIAAILILATAVPVHAAGEETKGAKPPRPSSSRIEALMNTFESGNFVERELAQRELRSLGFHHPDVVLDPLAERWFGAADEEGSLRFYSCLFNIKHDLFYKDPIGFVGISMLSSSIMIGNRQRDCITIREVVPETAAERARLQASDRILSVDGLPFDGLDNRTNFFSEYVRSKQPGQKIEIEIVRGAEILTIPIELGERPKHYQLVWQDRFALQSEFTGFLEAQRQRLGLEENGAEKKADPDTSEESSPGRPPIGNPSSR